MGDNMEDDNKNYTVYIHVNNINGKMYVGITRQSVEQRWQNGKGYKYCAYFQRAIQKYGWQNFSHRVYAAGLSKECACEKEKF